jgi:hypothetical protein
VRARARECIAVASLLPPSGLSPLLRLRCASIVLLFVARPEYFSVKKSCPSLVCGGVAARVLGVGAGAPRGRVGSTSAASTAQRATRRVGETRRKATSEPDDVRASRGAATLTPSLPHTTTATPHPQLGISASLLHIELCRINTPTRPAAHPAARAVRTRRYVYPAPRMAPAAVLLRRPSSSRLLTGSCRLWTGTAGLWPAGPSGLRPAGSARLRPTSSPRLRAAAGSAGLWPAGAAGLRTAAGGAAGIRTAAAGLWPAAGLPGAAADIQPAHGAAAGRRPAAVVRAHVDLLRDALRALGCCCMLWLTPSRGWFIACDRDSSGNIDAKELQQALVNGDWVRAVTSGLDDGWCL